MNALVLSALSLEPGAGAGLLARLGAAFRDRGFEVDTVDVLAAHVKACQGCGSCGLRTPGHCVLGDDMQEIFPRIVASRVLVLAGPIRFGAHAAALKKVIDRFQPLVMPVYTIRRGEMKFEPRYEEMPALLGVGLLAEGLSDNRALAEADAYSEMVARNAFNMATTHASAVVSAADSPAKMADKLSRALDAVLEVVS